MSGARFWLTSDRLALRQFTPDDIDWLADLYSDPDVTRYLGGVKDRAKSEELLGTRILQYYDEHPGLGVVCTQVVRHLSADGVPVLTALDELRLQNDGRGEVR